ncbi:entry exclusion lipoprotein TrbK [Halomonas sp. 18H]|nr:entry exclusion lipoprotein TrbK [Halomonas sp. 18H]MCW4150271.1 entry exclusion lipoprotein TrbK [Halomonas sp. 18H]
MKKPILYSILAAVTLMMVGCGYDLPEVTVENCMDSAIGQDVADNASTEQQQEFIQECERVVMDSMRP